MSTITTTPTPGRSDHEGPAAAAAGQVAVLEALIAAEADVNITAKDGWTALGAARMIGADDIAAMLRAAGARP